MVLAGKHCVIVVLLTIPPFNASNLPLITAINTWLSNSLVGTVNVGSKCSERWPEEPARPSGT